MPTPRFGRSPGPGGEGDSFGLQVPPLAGLPGAGGLQPRFYGDPSTPPSSAERGRGPRQNPFPPGFLIHRRPRRAILARENWGWASKKGKDGSEKKMNDRDFPSKAIPAPQHPGAEALRIYRFSISPAYQPHTSPPKNLQRPARAVTDPAWSG